MRRFKGDIFAYLLLFGFAGAVIMVTTLSSSVELKQHEANEYLLSRLGQLNSKLDRELFRVRMSELKHYDSIVRSIHEIRRLDGELREGKLSFFVGENGRISALLGKSHDLIETKIGLLGKILSSHAVLGNLVNHYPTRVREFVRQHGDEWSLPMEQLLSAVMQYHSSPSAGARERLLRQIDEIREGVAATTIERDAGRILSHGRLVIETQDRLGGHLSELLAIPLSDSIREISSHYKAEAHEVMVASEQHRLMLLLAVWALLLAMAYALYLIRYSKKAMQLSEERLRFAVEGSNFGLWDWDIPNDRLYLSPQFEAILELKPGELKPRIDSLYSHIHPDDLDHFKEQLDDHLNGRSLMLESEHRCRDSKKEWIWVLTSGKVVEWGTDGKALRVVGTRADISERKRDEEELRLGAQVFDTMSEGVMVCDADNRIVAINRAFRSITGYSSDEVMGKNPGILSSGRHDPAFFQAMWDSISETGFWSGEIWNRRKGGALYPEWLSIASVKDSDGQIIQYIAVFSDITKRKESEELIRYQANYDALTELPNRNMLLERLQYEMDRADREKKRVVLMFIDLDRFKPINDTFGHAVGDSLLREVAQRLDESIRKTDMVARFGGDEFTVVLPALSDLEEAKEMAKRFLAELALPYILEGQELFISSSIGITIYPDDGGDIHTLLRNADSAMYHSKREGRNTFSFFSSEMDIRNLDRLNLEGDLEHAMARGELTPYYQPIIDMESGKLIGAEALLRWRHPEHGIILPESFISLAESSGQMGAIGIWLLGVACRQALEWQKQGYPLRRMTVNISRRQLREGSLADEVTSALNETGFSPGCLELDIREKLIVDESTDLTHALGDLNRTGVRLSIDDFGTGHSSISYLKQLPFNTLKIDRSFVNALPGDTSDATLVKAMVTMAHGLELEVVAEGLETEAQLDYMRRLGCDFAQGYHFTRPAPAEIFERYMDSILRKSS